MKLFVRPSTDDDIAAITDIYAHAVWHGTASFELDAPSAETMTERRAALLAGGFPYLVAGCKGRLLGYAYAGPYRARPACAWTVEDSVYVAPDATRWGVRRALLARLIAETEGLGLPPDGRRHRQRRLARLDRAAPRAGVPRSRALRRDWLEARTLAIQRADAAGARRGF